MGRWRELLKGKTYAYLPFGQRNIRPVDLRKKPLHIVMFVARTESIDIKATSEVHLYNSIHNAKIIKASSVAHIHEKDCVPSS